MTNEELIEKLADLEHRQWACWTRHMLDVLEEVIGLGLYEARDNYLSTPGVEKARGYLQGWRRQIATPYANLSEAEKDKDREWARKVLAVLADRGMK